MMSNQKRLEEYLVGEKGYLKVNLSNGKVIMLSGKWGSGKTHFWKNKIQTVLNDNDKKIPNHYISLYGKTSIEEIKNEVFLKVFESVDSFELEEKGTKLAKNTVELISLFTKSVGIDLSKIIDKPFENFQKMLDDKKLKKTEEYLNSGAIICFDDFERKSKDIYLNDLFGFITQLTLNFDCKVVIILNDDVFEGEEKNVFSRVKEKSVSKFLKYEPSIEELFNLIFEVHEINKKFSDIKTYVLEYIKEINILNARIYNQVLDNLLEWLIKYPQSSNYERRYLVIATILFIQFHTIFLKDEKAKYFIKGFNDKLELKSNNYNSIRTQVVSLDKLSTREFKFYEDLNKYFNDFEKSVITSDGTNFWKEYIVEFKEFYTSKYYANYLKIGDNLSDIELNKINNFIESGILINE